jgi:hypothetical protein
MIVQDYVDLQARTGLTRHSGRLYSGDGSLSLLYSRTPYRDAAEADAAALARPSTVTWWTATSHCCRQFMPFRFEVRAPISDVTIPYPVMAIMPGAVTISAFRALRRRRRDRLIAAGRCTACGYDVRVNAGRCPECGTTTSTPGGKAGDETNATSATGSERSYRY